MWKICGGIFLYKQKCAIKFPGLQGGAGISTVKALSKKGMKKVFGIFLDCADLLGNVANLIVEKNRTHELEKRLNLEKEVLDAQIDNKMEQSRIEALEYAKRLQSIVKEEKEKIELAKQKIDEEMRMKTQTFEVDYENFMRTSIYFKELIFREKKFLEETQEFIDIIEADYENRKEYVLCCDLRKKALEQIEIYLKELV